jgi:N-methylhydantoinase A
VGDHTSDAALAFDVGGTFTDILVRTGDGTIATEKVLSRADEVVATVARSLTSLIDTDGGRPVQLRHGTTVASNALLESTGPTTGLLTTRGFRDELELRRQARPGVYDYGWERTPPLIPRANRVEVTERIDATGAVVVPLDVAEARVALTRLREQRVEALAIVFVNSYANPEHEVAALALAREVLPDIPICASHEVMPLPREYERTSTTAVNAYLMPVVTEYLDRLETQVDPRAPELQVMQSNGGLMSSARARRRPIQMVESGPAGGVLAARALARETGLANVVSFDMGGTTVKTCLIEHGEADERAEYEVGGSTHAGAGYNTSVGYALSVPSFDIVEVGAGGGSIAVVVDGILRVGPRSAGADPGPVAYGRGGTDPTVTDANVVLGYIDPVAIAGGTVHIDSAAAAAVIGRRLGDPLQRSVDEAAFGVFQVVNAAMTRSIRAVTTERGRDPRMFSLVAFGGAGPIHAAALADQLGIGEVRVPLFPGLFSALGILLADVRRDLRASCVARLDADDVRWLDRAHRDLLARLEAIDGPHQHSVSGATITPWLHLRYQGQSSELAIAIPADIDWAHDGLRLREAFHVAHERQYGYRRVHEPVVAMSIHLRVHVPSGAPTFAELARSSFATPDPVAVEPNARTAYFGPEHGSLSTTVLSRVALSSNPVQGPLIVEEFSTTIVVPPGWTAALGDLGEVVMRSVTAPGPDRNTARPRMG